MTNGEGITIVVKDGVAHILNIDFDVAVTIETKENTVHGIKGGIKVTCIFSIGIGSKTDGTFGHSKYIPNTLFHICIVTKFCIS